MLINLSIVAQEATGLTAYARQVVPHLRSLQPTLVSAEPLPGFSHYPIAGNLTSDQKLKGHLGRLRWTQFQLPRIYRQLRSSLLFSPVPEAPLAAGCRFVVMVHDLIPLRFPRQTSPLTQYFRFWVPQVLRQATHILCNSDATAQDISQFYGIPAQKITPILLSYDAAHFRPAPCPEPIDRPYFLYIGRHDPYKNVQRLIGAFATLPADYDLYLVGSLDDRYTPLLRRQAADLGLGDRVKFLGYVPYAQLPILLSQAIGFVFASLWEGFGIPVLEAMACGAPVITSDLASLPEVAGDAALRVDPYSEAAIAAAMQQLAIDGQLRSDLRVAGLKRAAQFSWEKTGQATAAALQNYL